MPDCPAGIKGYKMVEPVVKVYEKWGLETLDPSDFLYNGERDLMFEEMLTAIKIMCAPKKG